jgi:hypothetical protein
MAHVGGGSQSRSDAAPCMVAVEDVATALRDNATVREGPGGAYGGWLGAATFIEERFASGEADHARP